MNPGIVILILKTAVVAVTILLLASLAALVSGRVRLHGRINMVFFILTALTVVGFEVIVRIILPDFTADFSPEQREMLLIHLCFSIPSTVLLPAMLYTGLRHRKTIHVAMGLGFLLLWTGTFVTGVFFLPHSFAAAP